MISLPLAIVLPAFCPVMYMEQRRLPFGVVPVSCHHLSFFIFILYLHICLILTGVLVTFYSF